MQVELKQIQREVGITFVFVTHDQGEALSMSDRVAVFDSGRLVQVGSPSEIYEQPSSRFVADFVGASNVLSEERSLEWLGVKALHSLRPERVQLVAGMSGEPDVTFDATVLDVQYLGAGSRLRCEVLGGSDRITATVPAGDAAVSSGSIVSPGQRVQLGFARSAVQKIEQ